MQALLLTAGLGTRLDPITRLVAKPAVPLGAATLVEHVIAWLRSQGITDIVMNLHHRPESLTSIVGDGTHLGVRVRYSWEQPALGSAGGPRHALPLLDADPFLIVNGDTLCEMALQPLIDAHAASDADVTMAVVPNPAPERYNGIAVDAEGRVRAFVQRGRLAAGTWHYIGVQVAHARVFAALPDGIVTETVSGLYPEMVAARPGSVATYPTETTFVDVGTPRTYLSAALSLGGARSGRDAGTHAGAAGVTHSVVWAEARIDPGALLDQCIVAGPVHVPAGFRAHTAIILPASVARPGDRADLRGDLAIFPLGK
ncbi:MAG: NDP-sugar synthase [Acidobacteriota bacterium]